MVKTMNYIDTLRTTSGRWLTLQRHGAELAERMLQLTLLEMESSGQRARRIGNQCTLAGEEAGDSTTTCKGASEPLQTLSRCQGVWMEETRNILQVARLAGDELLIRSDQIWKDWLALANTTHADNQH
jgi:hypothetical protein